MKIVLYPDSVLTTPTRPVANFDKQLKDELEAMALFCGRGDVLGLAANQIGLNKKMCVVKDGRRIIKMVNPNIIQAGPSTGLGREGCLSLPGVGVNVLRFKELQVEYFDEECLNHIEPFTGQTAICIQHEVDHLNGLLTIDRVDKYHRDLALKQLKQNKKRMGL